MQNPHHTWIQQLLWLITITTATVGPTVMLLVTAIPTSYCSCQTQCRSQEALPSSWQQWCLYLLQSAGIPWPVAPPQPSCGTPPIPRCLDFHQQEGEQHLQLSKEVFAPGQEGRDTRHSCWGDSGSMCSMVMGQGLTNPHPAPCDQHWPLLRILQHRLHFCQEILWIQTQDLCSLLHRNKQPANLTSSSMATAIMTMNVIYPSIFPPTGIHKKFCIRTNIKNITARLDHFTGNRRHTWDCNVGVTLQKQQAIKQNNAACIRWECCSKESPWCRKNFN